jgi:broad specificity phosphatase PhoE
VSAALGEDTRAVRRLLERAAAADALLGGDVRAAAATRLGEDEMRAALGEGVALELDERDAANDAAAPPFEETGEEAEARFEAALQAEAARFAAELAARSGGSEALAGTLLVVSHGLCVEVASHIGGCHAAAIPVCGWVELAADGGRGRGILASGGGVVLGEAGGGGSPAELPAKGGAGAVP